MKRNFVPWKFHPRHSTFEPPRTGTKSTIRQVNVSKSQLSTSTGSNAEAYAVSVTEGGMATVSAATSIGLLRGLTTLSQLFYDHSEVRELESQRE